MKYTLGIELGSTRIKAVLVDETHMTVAAGSHYWENRLENGIWTYRLDDVWEGIQKSYSKLAVNARKEGISLLDIKAIGISAMMHGYLVFDKNECQLAQFRTWRNTITEQAAGILTKEFDYNIPERWSIAHLYQAILNGEDHICDIDFITTLAGYVHWRLSGEKVVGIGEASGMFPVSGDTYDFKMLDRFDELASECPWKLIDILPHVQLAGAEAGELTAEGARLLDPSGELSHGIPLCPPEGDAGTGMVATNSVAECTGNVSAGTSIFAMIVLEKELSRVYPEIDIVTTPTGKYVAMVHCNNCTSDLDAWMKLFGEISSLERDAMYNKLFNMALEGEPDCGGLVSCNYCSGEHTTGFEEGRPLFVRMPDSRLTIANFMRNMLYSTMATLKTGMDILTEKENVRLNKLLGHGGLFKDKGVAQKLMAGALNVPVAVMESASEGGPWGMALLAAFMLWKGDGESLEDYLENKVFNTNKSITIEPDEQDVSGFREYMKQYIGVLAVERSAIDNIK